MFKNKNFNHILSIILTISYFAVFVISDYGSMYNRVKVFADETSNIDVNTTYGDINLNGKIDTGDLINIAKHISGKNKLTDEQLNNVDVNGDKKVNSEDLLCMIKYLTGEIKEFPAEKNYDKDGDDIPDWYEINIYGTNPSEPDTDGDELTDYEEIYLTKTDPIVKESFTIGISDANVDCDNDGILNIDEIRLYETNPRNPDTDSDRLTDYEEIFVYFIDCIKPDSDDDGVDDGDEIQLGLNPSNIQTYGYPDIEYISQQKILANNEVLSVINKDNELYNLSVDIIAAGWADSSLGVMPSRYSYVTAYDGILGSAIELIYNDKFVVNSITLKFEIKNPYLTNDLGYYAEFSSDFKGIKRLSIFKYFEDINMILPIKTEYDIENNTVYTTIDELGTYCLMDMEYWIDNTNGAYEAQKEQRDNLSQLKANNLEANIVGINSFSSASLKPVDGINKNRVIYNDGKTFVDYFEFKNHKYARFEVLLSWGEANEYCKKIGGHLLTITSDDEIDFISKYIIQDDMNFYSIGLYREYYGMPWTWVTNEDTSYIYPMIEFFPDDMIYITKSQNSSPIDGMYYFICEWEPGRGIRNPGSTTQYPILLPSGHKSIYLDAPLSSNNDIDTDGDGLTDWEEIDIDFIKKIFNGEIKYNVDGSLKLPTLMQCIELKSDFGFTNSWVTSLSDNGIEISFNFDVEILPIKSDPSDTDSDGDEIFDKEDRRPLIYDVTDRKLAIASSISYSYFEIGQQINKIPSELKNKINNRFIGIDNFTTVANIDELGDWTVLDTCYEYNGLQIVSLIKEQVIIVAFRGTEPEDGDQLERFKDWFFTNIPTGVTGLSAQSPIAKDFVIKLMRKYYGYEFYFTGHSLGGNLAYNGAAEALVINNDKVKKIVTFNGLGLPILSNNIWGIIWNSFNENILIKYEDKIVNYHIYDDPVYYLPNTYHIGKYETFVIDKNAINEHNIYSFLVYM